MQNVFFARSRFIEIKLLTVSEMVAKATIPRTNGGAVNSEVPYAALKTQASLISMVDRLNFDSPNPLLRETTRSATTNSAITP